MHDIFGRRAFAQDAQRQVVAGRSVPPVDRGTGVRVATACAFEGYAVEFLAESGSRTGVWLAAHVVPDDGSTGSIVASAGPIGPRGGPRCERYARCRLNAARWTGDRGDLGNRATHASVADSGLWDAHLLGGLDSLVRSANKLPGRKLVFFISGGFFLDPHASSMDRLQRVTSAAAKSSVVIYSMDARGLITGLPDASSDVAFDVSGQLTRSTLGELAASQDTLNALAADTGGRAVFNTNDLSVGLKRALKETSAYYLLAWKPEGETAARHQVS